MRFWPKYSVNTRTIHPTALVDPRVQLPESIEIGPYSTIDAGVDIGSGCVLGPCVHLLGQTSIGKNNRFHSGTVIGDAPQDLKYRGAPTRLRIGDNNVFRENVTVHRSASFEDETLIGSGNFLMVGCHVGHNCVIGDQNIIANGALLGGHVTISSKVFISGNCLVHQFCRIGRLALMQGGAAISKDLPPFTIARGDNCVCGLNTIGLRRGGIPGDARLELKRLYHLLLRSSTRMSARLREAKQEFHSQFALEFIQFVEESKRGVCVDASGQTDLSSISTEL